ncbi:MAG: CxxC-x17-CxxC domain-containing protein [Patescibacteria group bacterium]
MTPFKKGGFKKPFNKGSFGGHGKRENRGEMHPATCSTCGKSCEVPFRPTGERPIYCRDCFSSNAPSRDGHDAPRKNFGDSSQRSFRPSHDGGSRDARPSAPPPMPLHYSPEISKLTKQIEALNASIIKLAGALEVSSVTAPVSVAVASDEAEVPTDKKPRRKKKTA